MRTTPSTSADREAAPALATVARRALPELVLSGWTLFVWGGRLRNLAADETLSSWALAWRAGLSATFVGLALGLLIAVFVRPHATKPTALVLAAVGIAVWAVRGIDIALGDHSAAFIAVHTVLAIVTIGLGVFVLRRWFGPRAA